MGVAERHGDEDQPAAVEQAVDAGLLEWARDYINESIVGLRLGTRTLRARLSDPSLGSAERGILERLEPVFTQLVDEGSLYLGGAAGLFLSNQIFLRNRILLGGKSHRPLAAPGAAPTSPAR